MIRYLVPFSILTDQPHNEWHSSSAAIDIYPPPEKTIAAYEFGDVVL
jgi:hypothetical protein